MTSSTDPIHQLLQSLEQTQGDIRAQATLTAEFLLMARPEAERGPLRDALDAAAVLRWFDDDLLKEVLEISSDEVRDRSDALNTFSFVERYRRGEEEVRYIHEATRLGWRHKIANQNPDRFRSLSLRAAACFAADDSPAGRIEWVYHLLCGDADLAASKVEALDRQWSTNPRSDDRHALATALQELEDSQLLQGRARAWSILFIAWTRAMRGEAADLAEIVAEALRVAEEARDKSAQAAAKCLEGDVRKAQGSLAAAQVALEEGLAISQQLVEEDRENSVWQRGLGLAHDRMGDVLQAQGKLAAAHASFEKSLVISQRLAEQNPSDAEWLAIARGRAASIQQRRGTVAETPTYDKKRQIFERHALFAKLTRSEIDTLLTYTRVERYRAGRQIFAEGSPGDSMMVVLRGTVKISAPVSSGKEIVLNVINLGECFGEKSLLDGEERSADAIAMTDCELLVLNRRDFMPVLENHADICLILLKILCQRQRHSCRMSSDSTSNRASRKRCCTSPTVPRTLAACRSNCTFPNESSATLQAAAGKASTSIWRLCNGPA